MKRTDIVTIVLVGGIGVIISFFVVNALLGDPSAATAKVKTIGTVSSQVAEPNVDVFNEEASNPTVEVYVGDCQDANGDGSLSVDELALCSGQAEGE
jgi:hypothetical protein